MAKLNMAKVNTLIRKGYLLAGVMMAANIFVVNEMKAMENDEKNEGKEEEDKNNKKNFFTHDSSKDTTIKILFRENYVNLIGTLALSGFNNYLKWWDYNPGTYCKFVWFGWRSKRFLNDILQFEVNLNVIRGVLWLIPGYLFFFVQQGYFIYTQNTACSLTISSLFTLARNNRKGRLEITNEFLMKVIAFPLFILQGFISAPLTLHLSIFSIAISLDAILWELVAIWARKKKERMYDDKSLGIGEKVEKAST